MSYDLDIQLKNNVYYLFKEYYNDLKMIKIKDSETYSLYYAKIHSMLKSLKRYIIVTVPLDINVPGTIRMLNDMKWIALQAREIDDDYKMETQHYTPTRYAMNNMSSINIVKTKIQPTTKSTSYEIDNNQLPIKLVMLHTSSSTSYPDRMPLEWALKEFKIVIIMD